MLRLLCLLLTLLFISTMIVSTEDNAPIEQSILTEPAILPSAMLADSREASLHMEAGYVPAAMHNISASPFDGQEEYAPLSDPGFVSPVTSPLSTLAADVDSAAYANLRRMIMAQQSIPPDAVRIEELINAFPYNDPAPADGSPLSITTQVAPCPWNQTHLLLRVGLKARAIETEQLPPSNLVFLIDTSGSMEAMNKLPLVQRAFSLLVEQLGPLDRVSIVTYAGSAAVVVDGARGDDKATLLAAIADLTAGGGTHGADGIQTAYEIAGRYAANGVNSRIILATDGDFNIGISSQAELIRMIDEKRGSGIFLTALGFGMGNYKDTTMQALADHGNGNAIYIDTIHEARRALVEEIGATLVTVAKDVKLQIEFNPASVEGYRLIGYETRRLNDQDFADDTKDGGEMGAGHGVTALYELIPAGANKMPAADLTYQQSVATGSDDYATVHVRYKAPDGDVSAEMTHTVSASQYTDNPSDDMVLSSAIAAFGQLLMGSEFRGDATPQMILDMLRPMLSGDTGGRIVELSTLVRRSVGLYEHNAK